MTTKTFSLNLDVSFTENNRYAEVEFGREGNEDFFEDVSYGLDLKLCFEYFLPKLNYYDKSSTPFWEACSLLLADEIINKEYYKNKDSNGKTLDQEREDELDEIWTDNEALLKFAFGETDHCNLVKACIEQILEEARKEVQTFCDSAKCKTNKFKVNINLEMNESGICNSSHKTIVTITL